MNTPHDPHALIKREEARLPVPVPPPQGAASGPEHRPPPHPQAPPRRILLWALLPVALLILWGVFIHVREDRRAAEAQRDMRDFVPTVRIAQAFRDTKPISLILPGQAVAFDQADLFARATGYIAERRVDIGSRVRKGDLLLRIAAPDLDQQLVQAAAQLGQARAQWLQALASVQQAQANTKLADVTKFRATTLAAQGWETKQNADNSVANASSQHAGITAADAGVKVAEANFTAQLATVQRLQALTAFERVTAPFDGVITARNIDTGDLVSADAANGPPMFTIQNDNILRISVAVPQSGAVGIHDGEQADITVPELPGQVFHGGVSRSAVALAPNSRSLITEVDVPNPDHTLRPGLYVNVNFQIPRSAPGVMVPAEALIFDAAGMQVAKVAGDGTVRFQKVSIGRDFGQQVELVSGLQGGEWIALGLPAGVNDGGRIKIARQGGNPADKNASSAGKAG